MFVIAFDLISADADRFHPKGSRQAYKDIERALKKHGFKRIQWSVFGAEEEDLAKLIMAVNALRDFDWFKLCVSNVRAFRMEHGADLTVLFVDQKAKK